MLFNSYIFVLLFLPLTVLLYFILNHYRRYKAALVELIVMSFLFYAYNNKKYIYVLGISIVGNWLLSYLMRRKISLKILRWGGVKRKAILIIGIALNIGSIFYFKYLNFFLENMNRMCQSDFVLQSIVLPLGISFYTFQQISYLIDSYRGETEDYSFIEYAAFVSFFPQLVAGPIVLHDEIISQFRDENKRCFSDASFSNGIYAFAVGLFKKVLIADTFGKAVSWGWSSIDVLTSLEIVIVMLSYTFQIYFDFSGYCDMAVGIGKMFNIELPINFNSPYKACSIIEFWKRWHITLTRFLRNYVYFPLGGSKKGTVRTYFNILIVFLISGIWHGANWTFVLWGVLHGLVQVLNRVFDKSWNKYNRIIQWICTFAFVNVMWLIFRADSVGQAISLIKRMAMLSSFDISVNLCNCFALKEVDWLIQFIKPLVCLKEKIYGFYMWVALAGALLVCLLLPNMHEKKFRPTLGKALLTVVLICWSVVSFAGVSTFLYFNF